MDILQLLFNGLVLGSVIALAAVGLTLTYGILRLSNFAHGDFMTLGTYLTWLANISGINLGIAMLVGIVGTVTAMLTSEQFIWKPMRERRTTPTTLIIISIGLALFIRNGILLFWGGSKKQYNLPLIEDMNIGGVKISYQDLTVIALAFVAIIALHFLLQNTKIGKAMRAVADNIDLARVSGINVEKVVLWTWVITGILTALGGACYGLVTSILPDMGWLLLLQMFAAVILGGIGNPYGAIAGGLTIGIAQELSLPLFGSEYKLGVALLIMIVILLVRPQGLFRGTA
jgi:neutral amino acid transport system permease protein